MNPLQKSSFPAPSRVPSFGKKFAQSLLAACAVSMTAHGAEIETRWIHPPTAAEGNWFDPNSWTAGIPSDSAGQQYTAIFDTGLAESFF